MASSFFATSGNGKPQEVDISPLFGVLSGLLSESQVDNLENIVKTFDKAFSTPDGNLKRAPQNSSAPVLPYAKYAEDEYYHYYFDVPGASKEDIKLSVSEERDQVFLKLVYTRKPLSKHQVHHNELYSGEQSRVLHLPKDVDASKSIVTRYENGVLHIKLVRSCSKPGNFRTIPIL